MVFAPVGYLGGMRPLVQADLEKRVVGIVNEERRKAGLSRLEPQAQLAQAARAHSADMAARNYLSHHSPEGTTVADRVTLAGYEFTVVGENVAWGQENARQVMNDWMTSRGHRANILSPAYTEIGVGVAANKKGRIVWTQNFGAC
jgi:uncharacterized protein YkwD